MQIQRAPARPAKRRTLYAADNPAQPPETVDCSDSEKAVVAATFAGTATRVLVQLEAETGPQGRARLLLGSPFALEGTPLYGALAIVEHAGLHIRARAVSTTPYAMGPAGMLGHPSPLQTKVLSTPPLGVGAYGEHFYVLTASAIARYAAADWSLDTAWTCSLDNNSDAVGLWVGQDRLYVPDGSDGVLYAYATANGATQDANEIGLQTANSSPQGVWSDGTTVYVADQTANKVFAYRYADGAHAPDREFAFHADNTHADGIASDGTTLWVVDIAADTVFAYALADGTRTPLHEFALAAAHANWAAPAAHTDPRGAAFVTGGTLLIGSAAAQTVYAYGVADGSIGLTVQAGTQVR